MVGINCEKTTDKVLGVLTNSCPEFVREVEMPAKNLLLQFVIIALIGKWRVSHKALQNKKEELLT